MPFVHNKIPRIIAGADDLAEKIIKKTAFDTETLAKIYAPVDTGNLMNSISADRVREMTWRVTANADYAIYVEMGTRRKSAQPFLEPALRDTWPGAVKAFAKIAA